MAESTKGAGDSSKVAARVIGRANATNALSRDPKFKKYTTQVDKCLATFENVHEWADFIAFLTKLLKTLQSYMQFKEIPRKLVVGKRLAQCLNPALPTGVHQRALDVYSHVLAVLGPEGLKRDLQVWSAGLFPFFAYSATSVRPTLLNIYDTHYLALKASLRPVMKAFILAVLPGLEEENGEFFEKVLNILDRLAVTISQAFFLQNMWLVLLTAPAARGTAIHYLSRRFPKLSSQTDVSSVIGKDIGLMIRAFSASLEDDDILVRRGILELLNQSFKIDSAAFKGSHADDQEILMRAASGVVLRRDLSLSRRLYSWLLGTDEASEAQVAYFRQHGLEMLRKTLRVEMFSCPSGVPDPRPYKIFISLLDKWEIGSPLTEVLIIDSLRALETHVKDERLLSDADIILTASTLYEVIEPNSLWKPLFASIVKELTTDGSGTDSIALVHFVLRVFRAHDEEVVHVHLPLVFGALTELIDMLLLRGPSIQGRTRTMREALQLLQGVLSQISTSTLSRSIDFPADTGDMSLPTGPLSRALKFYRVDDKLLRPPKSSRSPTPLVTALEDLFSISGSFARALHGEQSGDPTTQECLSEVMVLLVNLTDRLDDRLKTPLQISWDPSQWLEETMLALDRAPFEVLDKTITVAIALAQSGYIQPKVTIDKRPVMSNMVSGLLQFLRPQWVPYHVRAVQLIWSLQAATKHHHMESIVAGSLTDIDNRCNVDAYEAFGVLWRLTDDSLMPGFHFKIPMMAVLDTLKSDDTNRRRVGETWMRCCLKSYLRVLDPILFDLVDPTIRRVPTAFTYQRREIRGFVYERLIDQRRIQHLVESLLSVVRFGGQGFSKAVRSTLLKKSPNTELLSRAENANVAHESATYMDVLIEVLLRFIQSEPKESTVSTMLPGNSHIQISALDLLQAVISRGEVDPVTLADVEAAIISKLYASVHTDRLDLQNKLLHVLHSVILAISAAEETASTQKPSAYRLSDLGMYGDDVSGGNELDHAPTSSMKVNPLFVQTLIDGLSRSSNRPILQHWIDFILMTVPQFQQSLPHLVFPLCDCISRQLRAALEDIVRVYLELKDSTNVRSFTTDADFIMLLNALERLVLLGLTKTDDPSLDEEHFVQEKALPESGGLLGLVSNVFSAEASSTEEYLATRSPGYYCLDEAVRILYAIWIMTAPVPKEGGSPVAESRAFVCSRVRLRCRKVLERLFRAQSAEVLESLIECWTRTDEVIQPTLKASGTFEIVDVLSASAQTVVHMLCESISHRITPALERTRKLAINPNLPDAAIFVFLEEYIKRLEGPIAVQVWNRYLALAKEVSSNTHLYKRQVFPALRCFALLSEKITQTTAIEERRIRKELQDTLTKLADTCILIAGRSFEQNNWIRRGGKDSVMIDRVSTPIPRVHSDAALNEKTDSPSASVDDGQRSSWGPDLIDQINEFIATALLPNLRRFLVEPDKILALSANIIYYVVSPAMKSRNRVLEVEGAIIDILTEMVKIPAAVKAWRTPIAEAFNDNRFFNGTPLMSSKWRPLVRALMDSDKVVFNELIAKVTTAPSANIFTNREYEMLLRSLNLRRLSYVLFAGEKNQYLGQLPGIQEKMVDILRGGTVAPVVTSEVYLCLRVLLCRLSPHNMNSFWPVILTEMFRVFEQSISSPPPDGADELAVILAACRFLDLVLVLQTDEFQVHQWMFVTDTVDAVYRPEAWIPEAVMDQLAEIIGDLPDVKGHVGTSTELIRDASHVSVMERPGSGGLNGAPTPAAQHLRRPLLSSVRSIDSIKDLVPFFSHISLFSYESVYGSAVGGLGGGSGASAPGSGAVDWEAVERSLVEEMFEGR